MAPDNPGAGGGSHQQCAGTMATAEQQQQQQQQQQQHAAPPATSRMLLSQLSARMPESVGLLLRPSAVQSLRWSPASSPRSACNDPAPERVPAPASAPQADDAQSVAALQDASGRPMAAPTAAPTPPHHQHTSRSPAGVPAHAMQGHARACMQPPACSSTASAPADMMMLPPEVLAVLQPASAPHTTPRRPAAAGGSPAPSSHASNMPLSAGFSPDAPAAAGAGWPARHADMAASGTPQPQPALQHGLTPQQALWLQQQQAQQQQQQQELLVAAARLLVMQGLQPPPGTPWSVGAASPASSQAPFLPPHSAAAPAPWPYPGTLLVPAQMMVPAHGAPSAMMPCAAAPLWPQQPQPHPHPQPQPQPQDATAAGDAGSTDTDRTPTAPGAAPADQTPGAVQAVAVAATAAPGPQPSAALTLATRAAQGALAVGHGGCMLLTEAAQSVLLTAVLVGQWGLMVVLAVLCAAGAASHMLAATGQAALQCSRLACAIAAREARLLCWAAAAVTTGDAGTLCRQLAGQSVPRLAASHQASRASSACLGACCDADGMQRASSAACSGMPSMRSGASWVLMPEAPTQACCLGRQTSIGGRPRDNSMRQTIRQWMAPTLSSPFTAAAAGLDSTSDGDGQQQQTEVSTLLVLLDSVVIVTGLWSGMGLRVALLVAVRAPLAALGLWLTACRTGLAAAGAALRSAMQLAACLALLSLRLLSGAQALSSPGRQCGAPADTTAGAATQQEGHARSSPRGQLGLASAAVAWCWPAAQGALAAVLQAAAGQISLQQLTTWARSVVGAAHAALVAALVRLTARLAAALADRLLRGAPPMTRAAVTGSARMVASLSSEACRQAWALAAQLLEAWRAQQQQQQQHSK